MLRAAARRVGGAARLRGTAREVARAGGAPARSMAVQPLRGCPAVESVLPPFRVEHSPPAAAAAAEGEVQPFAVVEIDGRQHKVTAGDVVMVDRQKRMAVGEEAALDRVLLVGHRDYTVVGRPVVPGAAVRVVCEEHLHTEKVLTYKKRRRNHSSKDFHGHRARVSLLKVVGVDVPPEDASM